MANVNFRLTIYQIGKANWNKAVPDTKSGFYLGFTVWGRRREWPKAMSFLGGSKGMPPRKFFEMNMCWDAVWCILRHNFEKCYSVCTALAASGWFFRYSYCNDNNIVYFFGGGGFYPPNTLDRTLNHLFF